MIHYSNTDDGNVVTLEVVQIQAFNYNSNACHDDGSCIAVVDGCIDHQHLIMM